MHDREAACFLSPAALRPWDRNPRKNDQAVATVVGLIERFGWGAPIVAWRPDDPMVIAGHTRLKAAICLGLDSVPVRFMPHLTLREAQAMALADNKSGELAEWDEEQLGAILSDLGDLDVSLDGLGFDQREIDDLIRAAVGGGDEPAGQPPEPPAADPVSELGEVYELGPHRLMCGSSTETADVDTLLAGETPQAWVMDPPFDLDYSAWDIPDYVRLLMVWSRGAQGLRWVGERVGDPPLWGVVTLAFSGQARGWARPEWPCCIHEVVYMLRRGENRGLRIDGAPCEAFGLRITSDRRPFSFYEGLASRSNKMSWAKNPACYAPWLCLLHKGEGVYDPCAGSGASLLATARTVHPWIGMELQPKWCDMIRQRWGDWAREQGIEPGPGAL